MLGPSKVKRFIRKKIEMEEEIIYNRWKDLDGRNKDQRN